MKAYFVTGTDTGIGKTYVTAHLMKQLKSEGRTVLGLKPIACGAQAGGNEDALIYLEENSLELPYAAVNPYLFQEPISPHLAARHEGFNLTAQGVAQSMKDLLEEVVDYIFIEGAGGVAVPINDHETMVDLMKALNLPVILVVGLRLGCLNHALLSARAIRAAGLELAAWVANPLDPQMDALQENIDTLTQRLAVPVVLLDSTRYTEVLP